MVGNEIADRNTKVSENSWRRYSETVTNEDDKEIPKVRYIFREKKRN